MTAELVRGQNHPLPHTRLDIRVSAGHPVVACATFVDDRGTAREEWIARPGAPVLPGVEVPPGAESAPRFRLDLDAVPAEAQQISVLLALAGPPERFGATAAPFVAVVADSGEEIASFTVTGLESETAVVALEVYRRQGAWKVRAVGQGYAGGLGDLLADQGVARAREIADAVRAVVAPAVPRTEPARLSTRTDGGAPAAPGPDQSPAPDAALAGGRTIPDGPSAPVGPPQTPVPDGPQVPAGPINYSHPRRRP
ncbi:TerD family protein, partial [Streptomyces zhihengii]